MLLAYEFDGEYLEEDYGGPVRGLCPYLWGYKSAKSVVKVEFTDTYVSGFWEVRGYPDEAYIEAGRVRDLNSGRDPSCPRRGGHPVPRRVRIRKHGRGAALSLAPARGRFCTIV